METELKFALSPDARERVERQLAPDTGACTGETHRNTTIYFDTPDLALRNAGFTLRVRRRSDSDRFIQTVKSRGDGYLQRNEWEWPVAGEQPDLAHLAEIPGLPQGLRDRRLALEPVFRTDVERTTTLIEPGDGAKVEVAFDHGTISAGASSEPLSELELELKGGTADSLLRVGLDLLRDAPLVLMSESKAERGYRLRDGSLPEASKAPVVEIDRDADVQAAFRVLLASVLDHLMANQPAAIRGGQAEGVHQVRVAIRRLRSLLMLFDPCLERHAAGRFQAELKRLGRVLGVARDWDVFVGETLRQASDDGLDGHWIGVLRDHANEKRHAAHQAATKAVLEPDFARFVLALSAWSRCGEVSFRNGMADRRLDAMAPDMLDRLAKKALKRSARSDVDDAESLHALRKSTKKLRYGIEYVRGLYGADAKAYHKHCDKLQKQLGHINDLETAVRLGAELTQDGRMDLAPALGLLAHWSEARLGKLRKRIESLRSKFERESAFW
jgi:inorganic triphosphatase YgiF